MYTYEEMRYQLEHSEENLDLRYFTSDFYKSFVGEYLEILDQKKSGFVEVMKRDFYNISSFAYCVFLQYFYSEPNLRKFRFLVYPSGSNYPVAKEVLYLPDTAYAEKELENLRKKRRDCFVLVED